MKWDTRRSWPRQVYSDRWRFEGDLPPRSWVSPLRARASFRRRAPVYVRMAGVACVRIPLFGLGDDPGVERRTCTPNTRRCFPFEKENRNFYTARLGISPEGAAPSINKPLGRICIRHLGKRDVYPSDTPDRLFTKCMWVDVMRECPSGY